MFKVCTKCTGLLRASAVIPPLSDIAHWTDSTCIIAPSYRMKLTKTVRLVVDIREDAVKSTVEGVLNLFCKSYSTLY